MDLKDFVAETLTQINQGVQAAREGVDGDENTKIGARLSGLSHQISSEHIANQADGAVAHLVHFDVALTVTENSGVNAKASLKVASIFSAQGSGGSDISHSEVSRIRFTIPISFESAPSSYTQMPQRRKSSMWDK